MGKTKFIWDEVNDVVQMETDAAGAVQAVYTYEPAPYGRLISQRRSGVTHFYHHDGLASTRALTDNTGTVTDTNMYDAWGVNQASSGTTENPWRWLGLWAFETGAPAVGVCSRDRQYGESIGRWRSAVIPGESPWRTGYRLNRNSPLSDFSWESVGSRAQRARSSEVPVVAPRPSFPSEVTAELDCPSNAPRPVEAPRPCAPRRRPVPAPRPPRCDPGKCVFRLWLRAGPAPDGRSVLGGARICFEQAPGEYFEEEPPTRRTCQSEINRNVREDDHFTIILLDGTVCKFTADLFPGNRPFPPRRWPKGCDGIFTFEPFRDREPFTGGCYRVLRPARRITADSEMELACFCPNTGRGGAKTGMLRLRTTTP